MARQGQDRWTTHTQKASQRSEEPKSNANQTLLHLPLGAFGVGEVQKEAGRLLFRLAGIVYAQEFKVYLNYHRKAENQ